MCTWGEGGLERGWARQGAAGLWANKAAWLYAKGNWEPQRLAQLLSGGALVEQDWEDWSAT